MNYVNGNNVNDALAKVPTLNLKNEVANLTRTWNTSDYASSAAFAEDFLTSERAKENVNYYIVIDKPVNNTKTKPFSVKSVSTKGPRKYKMGYSIVDEDNQIHGSSFEKSDALMISKGLVTTHKKNMIVKVGKKVVEGEEIAAVVEYSPSKWTKEGSYLFFSKSSSL